MPDEGSTLGRAGARQSRYLDRRVEVLLTLGLDSLWWTAFGTPTDSPRSEQAD